MGWSSQLKHVHNSKTRTRHHQLPRASFCSFLWFVRWNICETDLMAAGASSGHLILFKCFVKKGECLECQMTFFSRCCNSQHVPQTWYLYALIQHKRLVKPLALRERRDISLWTPRHRHGSKTGAAHIHGHLAFFKPSKPWWMRDRRDHWGAWRIVMIFKEISANFNIPKRKGPEKFQVHSDTRTGAPSTRCVQYSRRSGAWNVSASWLSAGRWPLGRWIQSKLTSDWFRWSTKPSW